MTRAALADASSPNLSGLPPGEPGHGDTATRAHPFEIPDAERYERRRTHAVGGMGRIVVAFDRRLNREVALKELALTGPPGSGADLHSRLAQEAWVTAQLAHPGIVQVHDAGSDAHGALWFTMRMVHGRSLSELLRASDGADRPKLLRHVLAACEAVAYAHSVGIGHRDLKPDNILVGEFGETQVVDWGLARILHASADVGDAVESPPWHRVVPSEHAAMTMAGARVGTPRYMSPEQARGEAGDRRSDVFGLGVILFELLAGSAPFPEADTAAFLPRLALGQIPRLAERAPTAPPELVSIVDRALAPSPDARYPDARALARDLASYLDGRRVEAFAYSPWDLLKRFTRAFRIPLAIGAIALASIAIVVALAFSATSAERDRAQSAEASMRAEKQRAEESFGLALLAQANLVNTVGKRAESQILAAHALARTGSPDARGLLMSESLAIRPGYLGAVPLPPCLDHQLSADTLMLLCHAPRELSLWTRDDAWSPFLTLRWVRPIEARATALLEGADRVLVQDAIGSVTTTLDLGDGMPRVVPPRLMAIQSFARNGASAAIGWEQPYVETFDATTNTSAAIQAGFDVSNPVTVATARGQLVVALTQDGTLFRADLPDRTASTTPTPFGVTYPDAVALALIDAREMIVATLHGIVGRLDITTGQLAWSVDTGLRPVRVVRVSHDGRLVAVLGEEHRVRLLDAADGHALVDLPGNTLARDVQFVAPDLLLTLGRDLRTWRIGTLRPARYLNPRGLTSGAIAPDASRVVLTDSIGFAVIGRPDRKDRTGRTENADTPERPPRPAHLLKAAAFSPDGTALAVVGTGDDHVDVYDAHALALRRSLGVNRSARRVGWLAPASGAAMVVSVAYHGGIDVYAADRDVAVQLEVSREFVEASFATDARAAALLDREGGVWLLDLAAGVPTLRRIGAHPSATVVAIGSSFDPVRPRLVVADRGGLYLWSPDREEPLPAGVGVTTDLAISPDGRWLAAGDRDGSVRFIDLPARRVVAQHTAHNEQVSAVAFDAAGRTLLSTGWDGAAVLWDLSLLTTSPRAEDLEATWGETLDELLAPPAEP